MATKDVTDLMVCQAYYDRQQLPDKPYPYEILAQRTGQCEKVCYRAMERAERRGYIDCGVSLRTGWLTEAGKQLLNSTKEET